MRARGANHSDARSSRTTGATGRKSSRSLIAFSRSCMCGWSGDASIERAPSARGPNSIRPWNQPMILFSPSSPGGFDRNVVEPAIGQLRRSEERFDFVVAVCRAEEGVVHRCGAVAQAARASSQSAAPSAVPASPAAGCTQISSNGPSSRRRALSTQLSATPPAMHNRRSPVASCSQCANSSTVSSSMPAANVRCRSALVDRAARRRARAEALFQAKRRDRVLAVATDAHDRAKLVEVRAARRTTRAPSPCTRRTSAGTRGTR